jgi:hypothetical protein
MTLTGTVGEGVSPGCLTLAAEVGGQWTLTGQVRGLRPGARVSVRGYRGTGLVSHCQQGAIFVVTESATARPGRLG